MEGRRWWLAAGVVGVIVALGLILTVVGLVGVDRHAAPAAAAPSAATGSPHDPSVCGLTEVALSGGVETAPPAQWSLVGTIAAPTVDGQGPAVVDDDGFRSCFAHTPTGAVVAAANLAALGSYPPVRTRFNHEAIAPGPGRDALLTEPASQGSSDGVRLELAGFQLLRYTGEQADLDLAFRSSTGQLFGFTVYLTWAEGDWKARMADDGSALSSISPITDLSSYVAWGADSGQ